MSGKMKTILVTVLFLSGLSLLLYPFVSNQWNTYRQNRLISDYDRIIEEKTEADEIDYEAEWEKARTYNEELLPSVLPDSFAIAAASDEPDGEYLSCINLLGDGMMGYVEIPKISITIPLYHTVKEEVLEKAAGHLEGSSLPAGGENTHTVISAHRGLPSASLFTDLDRLEIGDHFLLKILDDVLCYEVDQITVVEPEETESLAVEKGKDYATLLTCTPYGVNTHRLLVRGHRVVYEPAVVREEENNSVLGVSLNTSYLLWVVAGLSVTLAFIFLLYRRERKWKREGQATGDKME